MAILFFSEEQQKKMPVKFRETIRLFENFRIGMANDILLRIKILFDSNMK